MLMIGHNSQSALLNAAAKINQDHEGMLAALEDSEARATRIGRTLIELKPTLKAASMSLTDFCKENLPFGKTTAYTFIQIAQGKTTLAAENARKYSASAEKLTPQAALPLIHRHMDFHRGLANLRAMKWVDAGSEFDEWRKPLVEKIHADVIESTGLPINKSDFAMATEVLAKMHVEGKLRDLEIGSNRSIMTAAIEYAVEMTDLYYDGYNMVSYILHLDDDRTAQVSMGNILAAKGVTAKQMTYAQVLGMTVDDVRILHALIVNHDANLEGLANGGHATQHPLWETYKELLSVGAATGSNGGQAEEWCAEAMIRTATGHLLNNEEQELLVNQAVNKRNAFWMIAMKVAGAVKERTKIRMMLSDAT